MDAKEFQKAYGKLVAKAWADEDFKARLLAEPAAVFKDNDIAIPEGVELIIVENTKLTFHMILPPAPDGQLNEEELENVAGGRCGSGFACTKDSCGPSVASSSTH